MHASYKFSATLFPYQTHHLSISSISTHCTNLLLEDLNQPTHPPTRALRGWLPTKRGLTISRKMSRGWWMDVFREMMVNPRIPEPPLRFSWRSVKPGAFAWRFLFHNFQTYFPCDFQGTSPPRYCEVRSLNKSAVISWSLGGNFRNTLPRDLIRRYGRS